MFRASQRKRKRRRGGPRTIPKRSKGYLRASGNYGRYNNRGRGSKGYSEWKYHDVKSTVAAAAQAGVIANITLNELVQGTGESERIGRKVTVRSIEMRGATRLISDAAPLAGHCIVRIILYVDKQTNGATATPTLLLKEATAAHVYRAPYNLSNAGRFTILMDKSIGLNATAALGGGAGATFEAQKMLRFKKRCAIPLEFDSTLGAITEIRSNNLGVLVIGSNAHADVHMTWRLRYSDQ